jgi:response regulator of citrate/malate metabolism
MKKLNQVIIIDDDSTNNLICENIIQKAQITHQVLSFLTMKEATDYLMGIGSTDKFPEIILLDVNFPNQKGWDFFEDYEKIPSAFRKNTSVYMITSSIAKKDILEAKDREFVKGCFIKPLTKDKIAKLAF